jgi:glycosyltransferase involved in cell wall biosynthesis
MAFCFIEGKENRKMKVAVVLNTSWNIYNFRMSLLKALAEQGHEVHTLAPLDDFTPYLTAAGFTHHNVRMDSRGANPIKDMALIFEFGAIYKKIKPDVVLHFTIKPNIYGTLAARLLNIPVINNVCGLGTVFLKKGVVSWVAKSLYKLAFRFPKKVFFQNEDDQQLFVAEKLVKLELTGLLPGSGINVSDFVPVPFKTNKEFTFLLVARLIYDKGIAEYIEAIRILRKYGVKARFQLLGGTDPEHKRGISLKVLDEWIKEGLVDYLGKTKNVQSFVNEADCIVLPSYREGSPRSLMEAACLQKPIITTDVAGCRHVVEHQYNGLLCKLQNPEDLAGKMEEMMRLPEADRLRMGTNGRKKMEKEFSDKIIIKKYLEAIDSILGKQMKPLEPMEKVA